MITLEQFRASRRLVPSLSEALPDVYPREWHESAAHVYACDLVIECDIFGDSACLTIGNRSVKGPLDALEADLFAWGVSEGILR